MADQYLAYLMVFTPMHAAILALVAVAILTEIQEWRAWQATLAADEESDCGSRFVRAASCLLSATKQGISWVMGKVLTPFRIAQHFWQALSDSEDDQRDGLSRSA